MITTCIFDLDGTLVDSLDDLANTCNLILEKYQLPRHPLASYRKFVGDGVDMLMTRMLPTTHVHLQQEARELFDTIYPNHCLDYTTMYSGIKELIDSLYSNKIYLAVVTNKPDAIAKKMVTSLFGSKFIYVYGNSSNYPRKPDPYLVNQVIRDLQVKKEEVLYIGDSDVDMLTGKNAGVKTIGVAWGFRGAQELLAHGADYVVDRASEIGDIIYDCNK